MSEMASQLAQPPLTTPMASGDGKPSLSWARWLGQIGTILGQVRLLKDGPAVVQGAGVPSISLPNGSLFLRTDGGGPNLYVREAGAWVAK